MEKEIKQICDTLVENHMKEISEKHSPMVEKLMEDMKPYLYKPYDLYVMHTAKMTEHVTVLINKLYPGLQGSQRFMIESLYVNCQIIKKHIENLVDCNSGGLTDKSTWLMEKYIKYVVNKEEVHFGRERAWSEPDFGNFLQWMAFVEQTILFINGHIMLEQYAESMVDLKAAKAEYIREQEIIRKKLLDFVPEFHEHLRMMVNEYKISDEQYEFITGIHKFSILYHCKEDIIRKNCMTEAELYNTLYEKVVEYLKNYMN